MNISKGTLILVQVVRQEFVGCLQLMTLMSLHKRKNFWKTNQYSNKTSQSTQDAVKLSKCHS